MSLLKVYCLDMSIADIPTEEFIKGSPRLEKISNFLKKHKVMCVNPDADAGVIHALFKTVEQRDKAYEAAVKAKMKCAINISECHVDTTRIKGV